MCAKLQRINQLGSVPFQVEDAATEFGSGLAQLGIETGQESFVGIYSRNCPEVCVGSALDQLRYHTAPIVVGDYRAVVQFVFPCFGSTV